jgi:hypothetical protein
MIHKKGGGRSAGYGLKEKKRGVCRYFNPLQASLMVLADCSCSCTPGSSLAAAHCSDSCSRTPGSSLAAACCLTCVLAPLAPLLLLLFVLTRVLAQLGLCMHCVVAQCWMIARNSSLQDWHPFVLDKEPWFDSSLVYNRNEDLFNHMLCSIITHLSDEKRHN